MNDVNLLVKYINKIRKYTKWRNNAKCDDGTIMYACLSAASVRLRLEHAALLRLVAVAHHRRAENNILVIILSVMIT